MPGGTTEGLGGSQPGRSPGPGQYPQWEYLLLRALGNASPNTAQLEALNVIARNEGLPDGAHNWLAITQSYPNEWGQTGTAKGVPAIAPGIWNKSNVTTYTTQSEGISAIADFIQHGHPDLLKQLTDKSATYDSIAKAFVSNGWPGDAAALAAQGSSQYNPIIYTGGSTTLGPPGTGSSFTDCHGSLISWPSFLGGGDIFSMCEAKALVGGFLVMTGVLVMAGGITIIIKNADDRFGFKSLASSINAPAKAANNGLSNLFNRAGTRRIERDQATATNNPTKRPSADVLAARREWERKNGRPWSESFAGRRASGTVPAPATKAPRPQVFRTAPAPTPIPPPPAPTPKRIPRKQKKAAGK